MEMLTKAVELLQCDTSLDLLAADHWPSWAIDHWPSAGTSGLQAALPVPTYTSQSGCPLNYSQHLQAQWNDRKKKITETELTPEWQQETGDCLLSSHSGSKTTSPLPQIGLRLHAIIAPVLIDLGTHSSLTTITRTQMSIFLQYYELRGYLTRPNQSVTLMLHLELMCTKRKLWYKKYAKTAVFPRAFPTPPLLQWWRQSALFLQINTALECNHHSNYCLNYRHTSVLLHTYPFAEKTPCICCPCKRYLWEIINPLIWNQFKVHLPNDMSTVNYL